MPITADQGGRQYVLGRGRVYVDRYPANVAIVAATEGSGERYIGNTPSFTTTSESEDLDHYSSEEGVRVKDASVQLQLDRSGSFTCDNIDKENLAMFFLGDASVVTQVAATAQTTVAKAKRGTFIQLGKTAANQLGARLVSNVTAGKGASFGTVVAALNNFQIDEALGRIYILPNAVAIADDEEIQFTFDIAGATYDAIISASQSIYCAIRFVSANPTGPNRDYYFPYVKISPDGDYNLKGDDWQTMSFQMEILEKASNVKAMYISTRPVASA